MSTYILKLCVFDQTINSLCINPTKWLNTLKQFVGNLPTNCFSVFDHFVKLALKGLKSDIRNIINIHSFITSIFFFWRGGLRCVKCVQIFQRNTYQLMLWICEFFHDWSNACFCGRHPDPWSWVCLCFSTTRQFNQ